MRSFKQDSIPMGLRKQVQNIKLKQLVKNYVLLGWQTFDKIQSHVTNESLAM